MSKWTFHRPASKLAPSVVSSEAPGRWTFAKRPDPTPAEGEWTFHNGVLRAGGGAWFLMEWDGHVFWHCEYGCKMLSASHAPEAQGELNAYHWWNCDYWDNEGLRETPF